MDVLSEDAADVSGPVVGPELRVLRLLLLAVVLLLVVVCAAVVVVAVSYESKVSDAPANRLSDTVAEAPVDLPFGGVSERAAASSVLRTVVYIDDGFLPDRVTIEAGDSVLFVNASGGEFWPASNIHPTHEILPEFDSLGPVAVGETYMFTFDRPGEWRYHDHLNANRGGLVSVVAVQPLSALRQDALPNTVSPIDGADSVFAPLADDDISQHLGIQTNDTELNAFLDEYGPLAALRVIQHADGQADACHDRAHDIGRLAYEKFGASAFSLAGHECRSGGFHGALEALFAERGTANLVDDVQDLCSWSNDPFTRHQCLHGVGHGIMAWTNYEIHQALDLCFTTSEARVDQGSCYGGVFMENVVGGLSGIMGHTTEWLRDDDPVYPCNVVKAEYQPDCYLFQTSRMAEVLDYDFAAVVELCEQAPGASQLSCWSSLGRDISNFSRLDPADSINHCRLTPDGMPRVACFTGAVQNGFWEQRGADRSVAFCAMLDGTAADECYRTIITRAKSLFLTPTELRQFCQTLPGTRQQTCTQT